MNAVIAQRACIAFLALMSAGQPGRAGSAINVGAPVTIELGGAPAGIALADFNGDGVDDVVAAHGDSFLMSFGGVTVFLSDQGCPADADGDGAVGVTDFLALLAAWGTDDPAHDLDDDGIVGVTDLLALLAAWGPCP